jgi:hypothetical protein
MTHRAEFDPDRPESGPEYFQRLLGLAYTRLFLLPEFALSRWFHNSGRKGTPDGRFRGG